jgi:hypothetical protein
VAEWALRESRQLLSSLSITSKKYCGLWYCQRLHHGINDLIVVVVVVVVDTVSIDI